jgi:glutamate 5-kinase
MCGLSGKTPLINALEGNSGSTFTAQKSDLKARQKWLASGSITLGSIQVDKGAGTALLNRKSLLTVGIKNIEGSFSVGEVVQLINETGKYHWSCKGEIGRQGNVGTDFKKECCGRACG